MKQVAVCFAVAGITAFAHPSKGLTLIRQKTWLLIPGLFAMVVNLLLD